MIFEWFQFLTSISYDTVKSQSKKTHKKQFRDRLFDFQIFEIYGNLDFLVST